MVVFPALINAYNEIVSYDLLRYDQFNPSVFPHFQAFGHNFTLVLNENNQLLTSDFMVEKMAIFQEVHSPMLFSDKNDYLDNGSAKVPVIRHCYFVGIVQGNQNSSVAVNTCNGLVSLFSLLYR